MTQTKSKTIVQRRATDVRIFGAAGYALLLQVGHPTIAAGVRDHSNYVADPWGRFFGTADFVNLLVYGSPEQTANATGRLREMHRRIRGTDLDGSRYSALEPSAYAWVHATLAEAIVRGHHVFGTEFSVAEKQQFWDEWLRLGSMLGVREGDLPDTLGRLPGLPERHDRHHARTQRRRRRRPTKGGAGDGRLAVPVAARPRLGLSPGDRSVVFGAFLARGTMGPALREKFEIPWTPPPAGDLRARRRREPRVDARVVAAAAARRPARPEDS